MRGTRATRSKFDCLHQPPCSPRCQPGGRHAQSEQETQETGRQSCRDRDLHLGGRHAVEAQLFELRLRQNGEHGLRQRQPERQSQSRSGSQREREAQRHRERASARASEKGRDLRGSGGHDLARPRGLSHGAREESLLFAEHRALDGSRRESQRDGHSTRGIDSWQLGSATDGESVLTWMRSSEEAVDCRTVSSGESGGSSGSFCPFS